MYFQSFSIEQHNFLEQINAKKCPSSIHRWESNSQTLDFESPPLTTRPGLHLSTDVHNPFTGIEEWAASMKIGFQSMWAIPCLFSFILIFF